MYILNEITKKNIEKKTGLSCEQIINMDFEEIDNFIEKRNKIKLTFPKICNNKIISRGSVYLFLSRFIKIEEIERKLKKI